MRKYVLPLTTTAVILTCGPIAATAQAPGAQTPGGQQSPTIIQTIPMQPAQSDEDEDRDQDRYYHYRSGMMGGGMTGGGYGRRGMGRGLMGPMLMRMIFSLMDADGDGKLSLQEFQAAHERIFKAMDGNKDGFVTLEEMQDFIRGTSKPASQQ